MDGRLRARHACVGRLWLVPLLGARRSVGVARGSAAGEGRRLVVSTRTVRAPGEAAWGKRERFTARQPSTYQGPEPKWHGPSFRTFTGQVLELQVDCTVSDCMSRNGIQTHWGPTARNAVTLSGVQCAVLQGWVCHVRVYRYWCRLGCTVPPVPGTRKSLSKLIPQYEGRGAHCPVGCCCAWCRQHPASDAPCVPCYV